METMNVSILPEVYCSYEGECEMKNTMQKTLLCWHCRYKESIDIPAFLDKIRGENE